MATFEPSSVVLASANSGKLKEMSLALAHLPLVLRPLSDFSSDSAVETGTTFVENAIIKARHASRHSGLAALADDSGLVVDALAGAPGVRSARYAGEQAGDLDNINKLLEALCDVDDERRACQFVCAMAYLRHADDPLPLITTGIWRGQLLREPRGGLGFGYDPIFYSPDLSKSAAQLTPEEKNCLSHRGQALRMMLAAWQQAREFG